jgi:hypothetical protein
MGESMSNDVQSHEEVAERVAGEERRTALRHAARALGTVTARIIGGSQVDLVNFSNRGVLFECDSRLLIGARASVRITTEEANLIVTGRVVRSRVKGLVNGALRYDAALVLDAELGLTPKFIDAPAIADDGSEVEELAALDAGFDGTFDPSPVEAYLAESEASLLEVAQGSDVPLHAPVAVDAGVDAEIDGVPEPPPVPQPAIPAIEAAGLETSAEPEPIAFEADAEIAFEPAVEFAFDDSGEAPASTAMFDATYTPPAVDDFVVIESQFDTTAPRAVSGATPTAFFDARPSGSYGDPPSDAPVAFEADEALMFDEAVEVAPAVDERADLAPVDAGTGEDLSTGDGFTASALPDAAPDDVIDSRAAVPDTEDRVLLQFAATVPHDLAELRRIAADNQW